MQIFFKETFPTKEEFQTHVCSFVFFQFYGPLLTRKTLFNKNIANFAYFMILWGTKTSIF